MPNISSEKLYVKIYTCTSMTEMRMIMWGESNSCRPALLELASYHSSIVLPESGRQCRTTVARGYMCSVGVC